NASAWDGRRRAMHLPGPCVINPTAGRDIPGRRPRAAGRAAQAAAGAAASFTGLARLVQSIDSIGRAAGADTDAGSAGGLAGGLRARMRRRKIARTPRVWLSAGSDARPACRRARRAGRPPAREEPGARWRPGEEMDQ